MRIVKCLIATLGTRAGSAFCVEERQQGKLGLSCENCGNDACTAAYLSWWCVLRCAVWEEGLYLMRNVEVEVWGMAFVDALVDEERLASLCALDQYLFPRDSQCNCHALPL